MEIETKIETELTKRTEPSFAKAQGTKPDLPYSMAMKFLEEYPDLIFAIHHNKFYLYKDGLYKKVSDLKLERIIKDMDCMAIVKTWSSSKMKDLIHNVQVQSGHDVEEFDQDNLINFQNCFFDMNTRKVVPHCKEYLSTIQLPYEYHEDSACPLWEQTVNDIMQDDPEKIEILQEFYGYCLTKDTKQEKALFMVGDGQNGKSTLLEGLTYMLGDNNVSSLSLRHIASPNYIGTILEKYANIVTEIPKNVTDYEDQFKTIVSGEKVTVNTKYIETYSAYPYCKLIFACNSMPYIGDKSKAVYRRVIVLKFEKDIAEHMQDKDRKENIKKEAGGIFNWALEGLKRLRERKYFNIGDGLRQAVIDLEVNNNPILQFMEEHIEYKPNDYKAYLAKKDVYQKYWKFCEENGIKSKYTLRNFCMEVNRIAKPHCSADAKKYIGDGMYRKQQRVWENMAWKEEEVEEQVEWE